MMPGALRALDAFRALDALGTLDPFRALGTLRALHALEPLDALAPVDLYTVLPAVGLAVLPAVFTPVELAVFLAHVLRGRDAGQGKPARGERSGDEEGNDLLHGDAISAKGWMDVAHSIPWEFFPRQAVSV